MTEPLPIHPSTPMSDYDRYYRSQVPIISPPVPSPTIRTGPAYAPFPDPYDRSINEFLLQRQLDDIRQRQADAMMEQSRQQVEVQAPAIVTVPVDVPRHLVVTVGTPHRHEFIMTDDNIATVSIVTGVVMILVLVYLKFTS